MDEITAYLVGAHAKLIEELTKVKEKRDRGDDDWESALLGAMWKYLLSLRTPRELIAPTYAMFQAKNSEIERARRPRRGRPSKLYKAVAMATASAYVTALAKHVDLQRALDVVSRKSGIDRKKLKNFRDNCHRAVVPLEVVDSYNDLLATIERERWSVKDITEASTRVRGIC
jgi:hypothetical protein